jgi:hypothetical protein
MNTLADFTAAWRDDPESHQRIFDAFTKAAGEYKPLALHRQWVEENDWGCGCLAFHWLWKLLIQEMPTHFHFLEIGVYRGQITSLVGMLAEDMDKGAEVNGISPFDGRAMVWPFTAEVKPDLRSDDFARTWQAWTTWVSRGAGMPVLRTFVGDSTDRGNINSAELCGPYDIIYLDGNHTVDFVRKDLANYAPMVKVGGYLVCDDSAWSLKLPKDFFFGFEGASKAVDEMLPPVTQNPDWEVIGSLVHLRVWRRRVR